MNCSSPSTPSQSVGMGISYESFAARGLFTDMTLMVRGTAFSCHRVVLANYSPYFLDVLSREDTMVVDERLPCCVVPFIPKALKILYEGGGRLLPPSMGAAFALDESLALIVIAHKWQLDMCPSLYDACVSALDHNWLNCVALLLTLHQLNNQDDDSSTQISVFSPVVHKLQRDAMDVLVVAVMNAIDKPMESGSTSLLDYITAPPRPEWPAVLSHSVFGSCHQYLSEEGSDAEEGSLRSARSMFLSQLVARFLSALPQAAQEPPPPPPDWATLSSSQFHDLALLGSTSIRSQPADVVLSLLRCAARYRDAEYIQMCLGEHRAELISPTHAAVAATNDSCPSRILEEAECATPAPRKRKRDDEKSSSDTQDSLVLFTSTLVPHSSSAAPDAGSNVCSSGPTGLRPDAATVDCVVDEIAKSLEEGKLQALVPPCEGADPRPSTLREMAVRIIHGIDQLRQLQVGALSGDGCNRDLQQRAADLMAAEGKKVLAEIQQPFEALQVAAEQSQKGMDAMRLELSRTEAEIAQNRTRAHAEIVELHRQLSAATMAHSQIEQQIAALTNRMNDEIPTLLARCQRTLVETSGADNTS